MEEEIETEIEREREDSSDWESSVPHTSSRLFVARWYQNVIGVDGSGTEL